MGQCQMEDGSRVAASNKEECWERGGAKWGNILMSQNKPAGNIRAEIVQAAADAESAKKAVAVAETATVTAAAATAVAAAAEQTAAQAEAARVEATKTAATAAVAADSAKNVRDKCIADANTAHQTAMAACNAKEGFGRAGLSPSTCMLWIMMVLIVLTFVAICMKASATDKTFTVSDALV